MFDYRAELERRIVQFAGYLQPMNHRVHEIAEGPCFVIFDERRPQGTADDALVEKREVALAGVLAAFGELGSSAASESDDGGSSFTLPEDGWRGDDSLSRFIQFSFENHWFCIDMPRQTLYRPEAEEILRRRQGFFFLSARPQFTLYGEDVEGFDPFRKIYVYGDERSAAEDMAFVLFQVWKFPIDALLYITSEAFGGKRQWEQDVPIV